MIYLWLKLIHILSSTLLFGTGIGTASVMLYGHYTKEPYIIAMINRYVVMADWIFTATTIVLQPLTGFLMVWIAGYSFSLLWIWASLCAYFIAVCCWMPVVWLQFKMRNLAMEAYQNKTPLSRQYYQYFKYWFFLGWPAFLCFLMIFYFMTMKPM